MGISRLTAISLALARWAKAVWERRPSEETGLSVR